MGSSIASPFGQIDLHCIGLVKVEVLSWNETHELNGSVAAYEAHDSLTFFVLSGCFHLIFFFFLMSRGGGGGGGGGGDQSRLTDKMKTKPVDVESTVYFHFSLWRRGSTHPETSIRHIK